MFDLNRDGIICEKTGCIINSVKEFSGMKPDDEKIQAYL